MPLSLPEYHRRTKAVRDTVSAQLGSLWTALPAHRTENVDRFVRIAVPKVRAGQFATARLTAQYLGGPVLPRETVSTVRPVAPEVEYRRPAVKLYSLLGAGVDYAAAVQQSAAIVGALTATDLQLALRAQSQASLAASGHRRYRRVLTGNENCEICRIASQNVYSTRDLLPIHDHCDCTVEPVQDDAPTVDLSSLTLTAARADQVAAGASYESLVAVREHGELGPVIVWSSDHFTGPDDLAA